MPRLFTFFVAAFFPNTKGNELVSPLTVTRGLHFLDEQEQNYEKDQQRGGGEQHEHLVFAVALAVWETRHLRLFAEVRIAAHDNSSRG